MDPALFERVQAIRAERRTRHPGGIARRRPYPLARLMRCIRCGSAYHGDANNDRRRIRHARRPACGPSATYRAERFEAQIAGLFDRVRLSDADVAQVLRAMRGTTPAPAVPDPAILAESRTQLQDRLASGTIAIEAFSREWRRLERPVSAEPLPPDELRPGVLVRNRMDRDDVRTVDIDPAEDLAECLLAQLIRDGRVPPQGAELQQKGPSPA